ncbi:MAG: PKD domain-containing protein, partial [Inhella sp.]
MRLNPLLALLLSSGALPALAYDCTGLPEWSAGAVYTGGKKVQQSLKAYEAKWWTQNDSPALRSGQWDVWKPLGTCDGGTPNQPPVASFTHSSNGLTLSVNGAASSDPEGQALQYAWAFGDGSTASGAQASRSYASAGSYTVTLTVTDPQGASASSSRVITVSSGANQAPTVQLSSPTDGSSVSTGSVLSLAANAADADGSVAKVGFYVNGSLVGEDSTAPYAVNWTAAGTSVDIVARATDNLGASRDSTAVRISIGAPPTGHERCRPDGLVTSPGTAPAYCKVYDEQGRELMGADKPRRIIGYFTSWRTGKNGQPAYLAHQIPWA